MITVLTALGEFFNAIEADGLKANTRKWYSAMLKDFGHKFATNPVADVSAAMMRDYVIGVRKSAKSQITAIDKITALHKFWGWSAGEYTHPNPMARIRRPSRPTPHVKAPTIDHVRALAAAIPKNNHGIRDLALLMLVIDACLRISEALNLRLEDVDFFHHQITIHRSKNDKTRVVPFTRDVEAVLIRWLKRRLVSSDYIFTTDSGHRLKYAGARQLLRRMHVKAGLETFFSWHKYRHFGAQQYRMAGGNIFDLQKILGHEEITTTVNHYGNFIADELVDKHEFLSAVNVLREDKGI